MVKKVANQSNFDNLLFLYASKFNINSNLYKKNVKIKKYQNKSNKKAIF